MIGRAILHYQITDELAVGGMGVLFRALDTRLGRQVALKFLAAGTTLDDTARQRLMAEARAAAGLDHPNIGTIHAIEDADGSPFIVMALYQGQSVRERLSAGPLPLDTALDIVRQAAVGLGAAHAAGIVHRDVKPENLFVTEQGLVKVLDFGLAQQRDITGLTTPGAVVGTLPYMSPEQVRGQAVDARTDVWALGVVLYEMLTGISPFRTEGGITATILKVIKDEPEPVALLRPEVPPRIGDVLAMTLQKDRDGRPRDAGSLARELDEALHGTSTLGTVPVAAVPPPMPAPTAAKPPASAAPSATLPDASSVASPELAIAPLPSPSTPLVGRSNELEIISTNLADPHCRVLTLVGIGGNGKTRLALEAAHRARDGGTFPDGVAFVALDALSDHELVPSAIATVLGIGLQGTEPPLEQIARRLAKRSLLLVLDNYEHVMDGASLAAALVQRCPDLKVLATSRERLNLDEEWVLPLVGLSVPEREHASAEDALVFDSVQLFLHRAKRASLHFEFSDEDPPHVCRICRMVGGSPLAIELAAAWAKMMPCHEIAAEITKSLDFLESSSRNVTERHRSIRACFEYSWALLSARERNAFTALTVFRGGFTRDAAAKVADANLPLLMALADKSLLHVNAGRYEMHPLIHHYASEKLADEPERAVALQRKHTAYFLAFLDGCSGQKDELARLDEELSNVLHATEVASTLGDDATLVAMMRVLALDGRYFAARGHTMRSMGLLRAAAAAAHALGQDVVSARLTAKLGDHHKLALGELEPALSAYHQALALAEDARDAHWQAILLSLIGETRFEQNESDADAYLTRALTIASEHEDRLAQSHVLQHQGFVAGTRGEWERARALFQSAIDVLGPVDAASAEDLAYNHFMALLNLGEAERALGNGARSVDLRLAALATAEARDNWRWKAAAHHELGEVFHALGRRDEAKSHLEQALDLWRKSNHAYEAERVRALLRAGGYATR